MVFPLSPFLSETAIFLAIISPLGYKTLVNQNLKFVNFYSIYLHSNPMGYSLLKPPRRKTFLVLQPSYISQVPFG